MTRRELLAALAVSPFVPTVVAKAVPVPPYFRPFPTAPGDIFPPMPIMRWDLQGKLPGVKIGDTLHIRRPALFVVSV